MGKFWLIGLVLVVLLADLASVVAAQGGASVTVEPAIVTTGQPYTVTACGLAGNSTYFTVTVGVEFYEYAMLTGGDKCETYQAIAPALPGQYAVVLWREQGRQRHNIAEQGLTVTP